MKLKIKTTDGDFWAYYTERGLAQLDFPNDRRTRETADDGSKPPAQVRQWHDLTTRALKAVLAGRDPEKLPPLDLTEGTNFQRQVWKVLLGIGAGDTLTYGEVAGQLGKPKAMRAVGGACGANPIPVLVPCHRVLAANQRIGGFTSGLEWKRKLLAREGWTQSTNSIQNINKLAETVVKSG